MLIIVMTTIVVVGLLAIALAAAPRASRDPRLERRNRTAAPARTERSTPAGGEVSVACARPRPTRTRAWPRALARDVDRAFEDVVIAYRSRIVTFVARMLRDDARAEDVAQDVFVRAHRALHGYSADRRAGLRLRSWLLAIAHNLTRNAVRDAPPPSDPLDYDDGAPRAAMSTRRRVPTTSCCAPKRGNRSATPSPGSRRRCARRFVMRYVDDLLVRRDRRVARPADRNRQSLGPPRTARRARTAWRTNDD